MKTALFYLALFAGFFTPPIAQSMMPQMFLGANPIYAIPTAILARKSGGTSGGYSDNFPGTSLSANWTIITGPFTVSSGFVTSPSGSGNTFAYYNAGTFGVNQQSCLVGNTSGTGNGFGPTVRMQTGPSAYVLWWRGSTLELGSEIGGGYSTLGTAAFTNGHTYCVFATGSSISATDNGTTTIGPITDTNIGSGGAAGIWGVGYTGTGATGSLWTGQ